MAEPAHELALLEWLKILLGVVVTTIGSAWGWWRSTKFAIYTRIDEAESNMMASMDSMRHAQNGHHTKIAVLETQQANSHLQLQSIHEDTKDIREKVDQLVMVVLNRK